MHRLGLPNEVKQAAVALYLDFKTRPIGVYNAGRKNLKIFLLASVSIAAKALGDLRTGPEFESKMFVSREKLVDAEERIIRSFGVQDSIIPIPELVLRLTKRQMESMGESFARQELVTDNEKEELVRLSYDYLDAAVERGLDPMMSYRGRAAGVMLRAVRDLGLQVSRVDIARAAGFDKGSMGVNANAHRIFTERSEELRKQRELADQIARFEMKELGRETWPDFQRIMEKHNGVFGG